MRRATLAFIFVTVVLDMLALGIVVPVLPKLVLAFEGGNSARAATIFGIFGTVFAAMQFCCAPALGALSDRFGRRPVILASSVGLGLDYVVMATAPTVEWLLVGRTLSGICAASFSAPSAYIADVTPLERRAASFGLLSAAFGLGFIIGPAFGGLLGAVDPRLPFWAAAGLSMLNAAYGWFVLPESLPPERRAAFSWRRANPIGAFQLLRRQPEVLGIAGVVMLSYLAHESLPSTFVLYADYRYAWDARSVGLALAAIGVSSAVVQGALVRVLVARVGERRSLLLGLGVGVAGFAVYAAATTGAAFCAGIPLIGLWGVAHPAAQALMSQRMHASEQGRLQGALSGLRGVTGMVGPTLFTGTFAAGVRGLGAAHLPGVPFALAGVLLAASFTVAWRVTRAPEVALA